MQDYYELVNILDELPTRFQFGHAHIAIDDGNLEDSYIDACLSQTPKREYVTNGLLLEPDTKPGSQTDTAIITDVILKLLKFIPEELRERPDDTDYEDNE